jgi:hypothetical protein
VVTSRRKRWTEHTEYKRDIRNSYRILVEEPRKKDHLGDIDVDGRIFDDGLID